MLEKTWEKRWKQGRRKWREGGGPGRTGVQNAKQLIEGARGKWRIDFIPSHGRREKRHIQWQQQDK